MAYFTAVLARSGGGWRARDIDLAEFGDLDALADGLRADAPVLALVEAEDEWFALFRVDGDEDPRLFVSDYPAATRSSYGELIAPAGDARPEVPPAPQPDPDDENQPLPKVPPPVWAGDPDLLDDLGVSAAELTKVVEERGDDPAGVIGDLGETVGFADLVEALR